LEDATEVEPTYAEEAPLVNEDKALTLEEY
jgi:hypothetical protein